MTQQDSPHRSLRAFLLRPFVILAAILMLAEEWLWEYVKRVTLVLSRLELISRYERWLLSLSPRWTLWVFCLPSLGLLPVKLGAVWLIGSGHALLGLALIVLAKIIGTAVVARSFVLCKPKLMGFTWFAWLHDHIVLLRDDLHARLVAIPLYLVLQEKVRVFAAKARHLLRRVREHF